VTRGMLFAVADDAASLEALPVVAAYARALSAAVHVLYVHGADHQEPAESEGCPDMLDYVLERLSEHGLTAAGERRPARREEHAAQVVAGAARRVGAALVAVGMRGRSELAGLLLEGPAEAGLDAALLVVRMAPRISALPRRILVALDGVPGAALAEGADLAARAGAEVIVLHTEAAGEALVQDAVAELAALGLPAAGEVVASPWGQAEAIDATARRHDADLVVVAPHPPTDRAGGLARRLVHRLVRPVLLARPVVG
jgi:nucleotide-binding universal stress UspA family protein